MKARFNDEPVVSVSALKNEGIHVLKSTIHELLLHRDVRTTPEHLVVANVRHKTALVHIRKNLSHALKGLNEGSSLEFVAFEIRSALGNLGELVGETAGEEVLNRIFEQFCIGK